jgi:cysteinyl-tRNA synthetase
VIVRHGVQDFADCKTGYDAHEPSRAAARLTEKHLLQDTDDANIVTLIFEAKELKQAEQFSRSDDLRETMQRVGVVGKPDIWFLKS